MQGYVDLYELAHAVEIARRAQRPPRSRPWVQAPLSLLQRWAVSGALACILILGAWQPQRLEAVALPGDEQVLAQIQRAQLRLASTDQLAAQIEAIAAELRRLHPYGTAAPSAAELTALSGELAPLAVAERVSAQVRELGDFETAMETAWRDEAAEMSARGIPAEVVQRHVSLLAEVRARAAEFRALASAVDSQYAQRSALGSSTALLAMSEWFAKLNTARGYSAIARAQLPMQFARAEDAPTPGSSFDKAEAGKAYTDPPTPIDLAETVDIQFSPEISQLAQSLGGNPLAIRNWVHDHIEFVPTFGSIQGADLTLLNRRGNAFDIASLTLALLRKSGTPARYVRSVVELPIAEVQNWLDAPTPNMALDLMQKGALPSAPVYSGGGLSAIRFEHVWVEAWLDFIPSRGVINRVPDQWVPFDVAFKQYDYERAVPWRSVSAAGQEAAVMDFLRDVQVDSTGGISGFNLDRFSASMGELGRQVAQDLRAANPGLDPEDFYDRRSIRPSGSELFEGTLPFALRSNTVLRYSELPASSRYQLKIRFYADPVSLAQDSPTREITFPTARIGRQLLTVQSVPATPADAAAIANYGGGTDTSFPIGQINVIPRLQLGDASLFDANVIRMGTQQYWRVDLRDLTGYQTNTEAYRFPAGTAMVFGTNLAGITAERLEREHAARPQHQTLPIHEALALGGQMYWLMHDHLDDQASRSLDGRILRLPSIGAFSTYLNVRYFFGIPRTASTAGYVTDVKAVRAGLTTQSQGSFLPIATHIGAAGSVAESASWGLVTGARNAGDGYSTSTLLKAAIDDGQRLFQISASNLSAALAQLQLSADAENEIRTAVNSGLTVVAHEREIRGARWTGAGYVIIDPSTGASVQRVEGGFAGGIDIGCAIKAISLTALCKTRYFRIAKLFLQSAIQIVNGTASFEQLLMTALEALFIVAVGVVSTALPIVGAVITAVSLAIALAETLMWLRQVKDQIENLTPEEMAELGITSFNDFLCNYNPACFEGFNEAWDKVTGAEEPDDRGAGGPLVGNPTAIGTGAKWQYESEFEGQGPFPLRFRRVYNSAAPRSDNWLGMKWIGSYFQSIKIPPPATTSSSAERPNQVLLWRPEGGWLQFTWRESAYFTEGNLPGRLERLTSGNETTGWRYYTASDLIETYDAVGHLLSIGNRAGLTHTLTYDSRFRPTTVTDSYGRQIKFEYDPESGYLITMTDPMLRATHYEYQENGNLTRVRYPDGTSKQYLYEDPRLQFHLTAIVDERGVRVSTWSYDFDGRVKLHERAGGVGRYQFRYGSNQTTVTDPLGTERTYEYIRIGELPYLKVVTQPCSVCSAGGYSELTYDARGLIASRKDFRGYVTTFQRNDRALVTQRVEALGTPVARTTTTTWKAQWHLPEVVTEPITGGSRVSTHRYDNEGNLETLTVVVPGETRIWRYTYNGNGQVLTEDGPRTDIADVMTYTYDPLGNIETRTDALSHQWTYDAYDADGQLRQMTDPNGLVTRYRYDERQRLVEVNEDGEVTGYRYDDAGNLERVTLPDGSYLQYYYDDAERVEAVEDNLGHKTEYELDGLGNRLSEKTYDRDGALVQKLRRVYDGIGRLQDVFGAEDQKTSFTYDGNGNERSMLDPLNRLTEYEYDELDRLKKTVDPNEPVRGEIEFSYDAQDNLRTVTDPRELVTRYDYTGFDELKKLTSPDTGVTDYQYDAAGNLKSRIDSRGVAATYDYDANNRLRTISYPAFEGQPAEILSFGYDGTASGNAGKGRLTSISDGSGTTSFRYDVHGRTTAKSQTVGAGAPRMLESSYLPNGQTEGHVLPSGAVVRYTYRADGRLLTIRVNGVEIVREIDYHSFRDAKSWRYGTSDRYERVFDLDGRIKEHTAGPERRVLDFDAASRIRSLTDSAGGPNQWAFDYDTLDRLKDADNTGTQGAIAGLDLSWRYDLTGNRTQETRGSTTIANAIDPASNRLHQVNGLTRQYDASGNTRNDGAGLASVYSARNRLVQTTKAGVTALNAHNAFGERVCKGSSGSTCASSADRTEYVYDDDGHLIGEYGPSLAELTEVLWLEDTPIAVLKRRPGSSDGGPGGGGTATAWSGMAAGGVDVYFVHPDHLDTPRVVVNALNQPVWRWDSAPFGDTAANENPTAGLPSFILNLRFPGQQYDRETGTHYNYFRDYEPGSGRYVQSDPVGQLGGINSYAYVDSQSLTSWDDFGLARGPTKPFQVGSYDELKRGSKNTGLDIHHVGQKHVMKQKCGSCYNEKTGPAIAIPNTMHRKTKKFRGNYCGSVRDLVNFQLGELRRLGVPERAIKRLGKRIYKNNPEAF